MSLLLCKRKSTKTSKKTISKSQETKKQAIKVLSLFSGCGGMDLGFEGGFDVISEAYNPTINKDWQPIKAEKDGWLTLRKTSFQTIFANDIRSSAKYVWTKYFAKNEIPESTYYVDSIVDLVKLHKENKCDIFPTNVDIVSGGFPCQDFSVAGKRLGFNSDKNDLGKKIADVNAPSIERRGQLYNWMREVVSITQPKMFIAENVKGLVNLKDAKAIIEKDFSTACDNGYLVLDARVLHAADYGVPQSRERVIFFGFKKTALTKEALKALTSKNIPEQYDPYPPSTHNYTKNGNINLLPPTTVRMAFKGLKEPDESSDISQQKYSKAKYMGKHCQGQNEVNLDGIGPTIRSEHHGNIEYRRLNKEKGGSYIGEIDAGLEERRLTVRECARIQTFPDDYNFVLPSEQGNQGVSASEAYKLIGNAVPPLFAYNIAKRIEKNWTLYFGEET